MDNNGFDIAIVGMAGRFPGAHDLDGFWRNLRDGVESIATLDDERLTAAGVSPTLLRDPNYVRAHAAMAGVELFDSALFGVSPSVADATDPQHRIFLECAWEALEDAGHDPQRFPGPIGVFAGASPNTYLAHALRVRGDLAQTLGDMQLFLGNDAAFLPTFVSYKLDLRGPSVNVQTACSTSLVAAHMGVQSLIHGESDMVLCGGVSIRVPCDVGYVHQPGGILSPDGHCRPFDAKAQGTLAGMGAAVLVLRRLADAIADGDRIVAIIKGSAVNNDGARKMGFTAPSVDGQVRVISEALAVAAAAPESISYIEAHGTGTEMGDPIEVEALHHVFAGKAARGTCGLGSVKSNIGHLDAAAGVAGLVKTALALEHGELPPSLHFEQPNPDIDFAGGPLFVPTTLRPWVVAHGEPRRAGVSSFGIGGTNAHVILEQAPAREVSGPSRPWQLLLVSAHSEDARDRAAQRLAVAPPLRDALPDAAYTLQMGRKELAARRFVVCRDGAEAADALRELDPKRSSVLGKSAAASPVAFLFPGQGAQYAGMAADLYREEPRFRAEIDRASEILAPALAGLSLSEVLLAEEPPLEQTWLTQPALFAVEYALARLWMHWGVQPSSMLGHSIGEYTCACLAGVFSFEDAALLVAVRGRLISDLPRGAMLGVELAQDEVCALMGSELSLAAVNGPRRCVVSGREEDIERFRATLGARHVACRRLQVSHANHSSMLDPILEAFEARVRAITLHAPKIPFVSNVTGTWITPEEATDPRYWGRHLRQTVRFADGLETLLGDRASSRLTVLEVGPSRTLTTLANQHPAKTVEQTVIHSMRHPQDPDEDGAVLLGALGKLWLRGVAIDWSAFSRDEERQRVRLPAYPFEGRRHWIDPVDARSVAREAFEAGVAAAKSSARGAEQLTRDYVAGTEKLERLSFAYMARALHDVGLFRNTDDRYTLDDMMVRGGIRPQYRQLLSCWLERLVGSTRLVRDGERYAKLAVPSPGALSALLHDCQRHWADEPLWIKSVLHTGPRLAGALTGKEDALGLLYSDEAFEDGNDLTKEGKLAAYYNAIAAAAVERWAAGRKGPLRVLEIGAGSGLTTKWLLPVLAPWCTTYSFTDVGRYFLTRAKGRFRDFPFVEYRLLDIDKPLSEQSYELGTYDLVVAANVLHVTERIGRSLANARSLLAPGGAILVWEITTPQVAFELTAGLVMRPLDDKERNQANPFLSAARWSEEILGAGFARVHAIPEENELGYHLFFAHDDREGAASAVRPIEKAAPATPARAASAIRPDGNEERNVAEVWERVLGVSGLGADDNFFELGGDSLLALQAIAQLKKGTNLELTAVALYEAPTVRSFALLLKDDGSKEKKLEARSDRGRMRRERRGR